MTLHCMFRPQTQVTKITALLFDKTFPTFAFSTRLFMKQPLSKAWKLWTICSKKCKLVTEKEYLCPIYKRKIQR